MGFLFGSNLDMGGGFGFGGSGNSLPRYVTDFANGFELPGDTYSGGPTTVADNDGTLVTSPAGVLPITGMRLTDGVWYPTDLSGDYIHASTPLRTTKGTVKKYDESYKGPLIEPARTNKVTCRKANPVDTSNLTKAGDAAATLTVVDDAAALSAAGLDRVCTSGKVYKLDNSLGTGDARVNVSGAIGSINPCFLSSYIRSDAATTSFVLRLSSGSSSDPAPNITTSYTRVKNFYVEAGVTSSILQIWAAPGKVIYFILPQLEESLYCTTPIFKALDGTDPLTALTRPAANLTRPTAGTALESGNNFAIYGRVVPIGLHTSAVLFSTYTDANNYFNVGISNAEIQPNNRIGGVSNALNLSYVPAAGVPFEYLCYKHGGTMGISVRSWNGSAWSAWSAWATNADTQNAPIASTYQIGARNNANHFAGNYPFTKIIAIPASVNPQSWLMEKLSQGRI